MKTGYLIDMDGVVYRENHVIPGASEFVRALLAAGAPFIFLTNNYIFKFCCSKRALSI